MFAITFNHYMLDDPYKQSEVKKGIDGLEKYVRTELHDEIFWDISRKERSKLFDLDLTDEIVMVYHTMELSQNQKQTIFDYIQTILTLKKSIYKNELPNICVLFEKKNEADTFVVKH